MKKRILIAVIVLALVVGAWFLGRGMKPEDYRITQAVCSKLSPVTEGTVLKRMTEPEEIGQLLRALRTARVQQVQEGEFETIYGGAAYYISVWMSDGDSFQHVLRPYNQREAFYADSSGNRLVLENIDADALWDCLDCPVEKGDAQEWETLFGGVSETYRLG